MRYDFKQARQHIQRLTGIYRTLKRQGAEPEALAWVTSEISCMETEIAEAHKAQKGKMTTVGSSGHQLVQISNIFIPIVPQWGNKEEAVL